MTLDELMKRFPELRETGFSLVFCRALAGEISPNACWAFMYGMWMHTGDSVPAVLQNVADEYQSDRHLCM